MKWWSKEYREQEERIQLGIQQVMWANGFKWGAVIGVLLSALIVWLV